MTAKLEEFGARISPAGRPAVELGFESRLTGEGHVLASWLQPPLHKCPFLFSFENKINSPGPSVHQTNADVGPAWVPAAIIAHREQCCHVWLQVQGLTMRLTRISLNPPGAEVTYMNMTAYNKGRLQSSFWIVDKQHVYIGSAGLDWQSLGQVSFPRSINSEPRWHQSSPLHNAHGLLRQGVGNKIQPRLFFTGSFNRLPSFWYEMRTLSLTESPSPKSGMVSGLL